ncbi:hypothetical protein JK202_15950 [Gluconobacter sp. Dm-62]|uniref:DUF6530 family protein n=1 Tax=Gluconobacter sp. Dm-62 TaxID=2799804 RepID=UPI001B8BD0F4|nr:DUF6530 family protein [Gluconobacter sp. Dm-62]MBS1104462.1 hypothetical protein [Gluconobacter sp. Dm-62]
MPQETDFPDQISHKPVYVVPYFDLDPWYAGDTDAQFITLGWSQWDQHELSAKVVRHSGQRWSRQSEELPLPRVIDLTILTALAYGQGDDMVQIKEGTFENQTDAITVAYGSKRDRTAATKSMHNDPLMKSRLRALFDVLKPLNDRGLI